MASHHLQPPMLFPQHLLENEGSLPTNLFCVARLAWGKPALCTGGPQRKGLRNTKLCRFKYLLGPPNCAAL